jgi:hypothetical protein
MNNDNLYIDDIANIIPSDASPDISNDRPETDDENYPDGLSTAGLVLFVLGLCLTTWFIVHAV